MIQEVTMKRFSLMALACLSAAAFAPAWAADVPEIPFDSVSNFLKLPTDMYLGEVSGVAVNSKKHIFIFNRGNTTGPAYSATAAQLLEFGPDGKFIREIGKNLYAWSFAHDVRVDKDDNIWAIDKGTDMIIRFNPIRRMLIRGASIS
jgi:streptogramin lyase